jgi:hypothetical protein
MVTRVARLLFTVRLVAAVVLEQSVLQEFLIPLMAAQDKVVRVFHPPSLAL